MSLLNNPLVRQLARNAVATDSVMGQVGMPRGTVRATIVDVEDPKELGRVRVLFDAMNEKDIPQVEGAGKYSGSRQGIGGNISHWLDTSPAFKGKQPPGLVGKRVSVVLSQGQYHYAVLNDVIYDPQNLVDSSAQELEIPNNSSMTRLPVYPAGQLPPPCKENHGCTVIEEGGPMDSDWMCICLQRDGEFMWVRHSDLSHGHAGGNDCSQQVDSSGNRESPVMMATVGDSVFPTTALQFTQYSVYTTRPQGNPKGDASHWYPPPMSEAEYKPGEDFKFLTPDPSIPLDIIRDSVNFPSFIETFSGFDIPGFPDIPLLTDPKTLGFLSKAQEVYNVASEAASRVNQAITDPGGFVGRETLALAKGSSDRNMVPPATEAALKSISNPQGFLAAATSGIGAVSKDIFSGLSKVFS
jgi:hypothetical protein